MLSPVFMGSRNLNVIIVAAVAALSSFGVVASEPVADETPVAVEVVAPTTDGNIVVTPVPMPPSVIELATTAKPVVKLRSAKGSRLAKNRPTLFPYTTLFRSRSEERRVGKECRAFLCFFYEYIEK